MADKTMEELAQGAMEKAFAAQLLATLDGPQRDALLAKAVADSLKGYEFKRAVEEAIRGRALEKIQAILGIGTYDVMLVAAIKAGIETLMAKLPFAVETVLAETFFGKDGDHYARKPGELLKHLKLPDPK